MFKLVKGQVWARKDADNKPETWRVITLVENEVGGSKKFITYRNEYGDVARCSHDEFAKWITNYQSDYNATATLLSSEPKK